MRGSAFSQRHMGLSCDEPPRTSALPRSALGLEAKPMIRSPTARLFVAVDPPLDVREQLVIWARSALRATDGGGAGANAPRVLDPELLHVTLCFLGNRPVGEMDPLGAQLTTCDGVAGELSLGAPLWLPSRHPRALAVELHDDLGKLGRLQAKVVVALAEVSGWQSNGRAPARASGVKGRQRFHPHITVARLRRGTAPYERMLPPTPSLSFVPREIVLYRSWLSPDGASYEAVASHAIG
jgi:RNA 2',3'-cyclic 3'-phosphodiesterase